MESIKKLPLAEFELMQAIWDEEPPVSTNRIMEKLGIQKQWKPQTALTLLSRLIARGFLSSERVGRERVYTPIVRKEDYLAFESAQFIQTFHKDSLTSLVGALYQGKKLSDADIEELSEWLKQRR